MQTARGCVQKVLTQLQRLLKGRQDTVQAWHAHAMLDVDDVQMSALFVQKGCAVMLDHGSTISLRRMLLPLGYCILYNNFSDTAPHRHMPWLYAAALCEHCLYSLRLACTSSALMSARWVSVTRLKLEQQLRTLHSLSKCQPCFETRLCTHAHLWKQPD